jgi:hypothetical protein
MEVHELLHGGCVGERKINTSRQRGHSQEDRAALMYKDTFLHSMRYVPVTADMDNPSTN